MDSKQTGKPGRVKESFVCNDIDRLEAEFRDVIAYANAAIKMIGRIRENGVSPIRVANVNANIETMRECVATLEKDATHALCTSGLPTQVEVLAAPHSTAEAV